MKGTTDIRSYADNRFEQIGVEQQMNANTYVQAKYDFMHSCMLCCMKGHCGAMDCTTCKIRGAFLDNARIFWNKLSDEEKDWVRKEQRLE